MQCGFRVKKGVMKMTKKEMVVSVLNDHGCQNSYQIKGAVYRKFGETISPQTASGVMRGLVSAGYAGKSTNPSDGKMVYWLTDYGKEQLFK